MFYGLTAGTGNGGPEDYMSTVAVKTAAGTGRVPFPRNGPTVGMDVVRNDASSFILAAIGIYKVTYRVHTTEPGELELELNGAELPETEAANANPTSGGHPIVGDSIIRTTAINSILAVINPPGNPAALTIAKVDATSTHARSQTITIVRLF